MFFCEKLVLLSFLAAMRYLFHDEYIASSSNIIWLARLLAIYSSIESERVAWEISWVQSGEGGVLNFDAEQPYFYAAGAYFYANQPYFYAAGACFYAEQPYFYGTCACLHGKVSHFYAEARFLRRTCVFLRAEVRKYLSSLVLSSCFRKIASLMALILPLL